MSDLKIKIILSDAEALVFFDFLSRFRDNEKLDVVDQAEERVLWDILAILEKQVVDFLKPNYSELLKNARSTIRDEEF